ncbi:MAG: 30S ribosomal protein S12 methylthiotransferase RimO [Spirochaetaceae bacterium]|jgi:ribosomal protein S12 methylthiotransferase|nr:30S ribosomal protein S12 methylthiotransferase RimO [Spirochaetaceae bacterium]
MGDLKGGKPNGKLFYLDQFGCAKNQVDGELLIGQLENSGLRLTEDPSEALLIIINSCGFIESAKTESIEAVMTARRDFPQAKILLAGCLAERYAEQLLSDLPEADGFFGNGDLSRITGTVEALFSGERCSVISPQEGVCCGERPMLLSFPGSAYVKITEGCDNRCTFCAIPLIRGSLRSRSPEDIINEIRTLLNRGVYEINLIGPDLASYGRDVLNGTRTVLSPALSPLAELLSRISAMDGNFIVRLLYIHPDNFPRDILPVIRQDRRILSYFDIPFQHGDDGILKAMNRRGTAAGYLDLAAEIRRELPDAVVRTTFMTGFPGETQEAFEHTAEFLRELEADWSGCFAYSREDDTPAGEMKKQVPRRTAGARKTELETVQSRITEAKLKKYVGQQFDVLIEEIIRGGEDSFTLGRCWFQAPEVDGAVVMQYENPEQEGGAQSLRTLSPGMVVRALITGVSGVDLEAVPV